MKRIKFLIASVLMLIVIFRATKTDAGSPLTTQPSDYNAQMETWWTDLQKPEPWASAALLNFSSCPEKAVAFISAHLKPLKIEQKELDGLLESLASEDEKVWKPAAEKLGYFDPRLNVDLTTLMNNADKPVQRNRLVEVLCDQEPDTQKGQSIVLQPIRVAPIGFDFLDTVRHRMWEVEDKVAGLDNSQKSHKKQWQRADRAIVLLQHIGSPAAIVVLKELATGHADAQPTKIAKAALESLSESDK